MVRQHCKYKFKCTLVMIINIHVTCGGGGGSFCLMDLGLFLKSYGLGPFFESYTEYSGCMLRHNISTSPPYPMTPTHVCVCLG